MKVFKRYWLIKNDLNEARYMFIYHHHKRVAYLYSGIIGFKGINRTLHSKEMKPIEKELSSIVDQKINEGYFLQDIRNSIVHFDLTFLMKKGEDNLELEDELWETMDDICEECLAIGISTNEGFVINENDSLIMALVLFDKSLASGIVAKHLKKLFNLKGIIMRDDLFEQMETSSLVKPIYVSQTNS